MPSIVTMLASFACSTGMRQLFTNTPSINTLHEPHSPSPQPSFVPVNPNSFRNTSSRRSIASTCTVTVLPFTFNETSHLERFAEDSVMGSFVTKNSGLPLEHAFPRRQKYLPAATESHQRKRQARLPRH